MIIKVKKFIYNIFKAIRKRSQHLIILRVNNKKRQIDVNDLQYLHLETRDIRIELVKYNFNKIILKKSFKEHLFNYRSMTDNFIRRKACLIKYLLDNKFKIEEISAPFLSKKDIVLFKKYGLEVKKIKSFKLKFIQVSMILLFLRSIIKQHKNTKLYPEKKSRFNPKIKYSTIFQAFDIRAEKIYLNKLNKSLNNTIIYIKPNSKDMVLKRKNEYIDHLRRRDYDFFFYIPKIKIIPIIKNALKIYLSLFPNEFKIPLLGIMIERSEIDDFINYVNKQFPNLKEFYNSEGFESSIYLTEKFQNSKIEVVSFAHGLGSYGPIVNYDYFYVFSKIQKNRYIGTAKFKYFKFDMAFKKKEDYSKKQLALFFIGGTFIKSRIFNSSYHQVIDFVEQIAREFKLPIYAKYHPESREADKILSNNIIIVEKIGDLPKEYNYLSLSNLSTYAIELLSSMPFLMINPQGRINLNNYALPNDKFICVENYQELKERINFFLINKDYYNNYWNKLISLLKSYFS